MTITTAEIQASMSLVKMKFFGAIILIKMIQLSGTTANKIFIMSNIIIMKARFVVTSHIGLDKMIYTQQQHKVLMEESGCKLPLHK